jgi:hypothetical protein
MMDCNIFVFWFCLLSFFASLPDCREELDLEVSMKDAQVNIFSMCEMSQKEASKFHVWNRYR